MDLENPGREAVAAELQRRLGEGCLDAEELLVEGPSQEDTAALDERALEEYLDEGSLSMPTLRRLVRERALFPCFYGSALKNEGVDDFLDGMGKLVEERSWLGDFAARVYRVSHGDRGERLAWLKVTGGVLRAKQQVEGTTAGGSWCEKVDQVRIYNGAKFELAQEVPAGGICAVTGLSHVRPGDALGAEPAGISPMIAPVLTYTVLPGEQDIHAVYAALSELADEDPMLGVSWNTHLEQIHLQLMGAVQLEVVERLLADRFGLAVGFAPGGILYKETIAQPVEGVGHFEPLRHYAEVHLRLEPLPAESGVEFGTATSTDELDLNWQRLALTNAMEREHLGVLTGSPITDMRITLTGGRAHAKHTEGGDFRQATYRAIRQGLMEAQAMDAAVLLEPWYRFELEVPGACVGRALADLTCMGAEYEPPAMVGERATLNGRVPASEVQDYALDVAAYTSGLGRLYLEFAGYTPCHDAERVVEGSAYEPEADLPNTPDSVFCSHGAGYTVKWNDVPTAAHVKIDPATFRPWRPADAEFFGR